MYISFLDGVSGTAKQHVADDYTRKIYHGINATAAHISAIVSKILQPLQSPQEALNFTYCENCIVPSSMSDSDCMFFAIFNPRSMRIDELVSVHVLQTSHSYLVETYSNGTWISAPSSVLVQEEGPSITPMLYFKAQLPAMGFSVYRVSLARNANNDLMNQIKKQIPSVTSSDRLRRGLVLPHSSIDKSEMIQLQNDFFTISFKRYVC